MSSKQVLWYPSVFLMVLLTGQTHSLGFDGHKDSAESLKWYTLKCYQGRTPYRSSKSELHPQLFVAKSHIYENVSRAALFIPQFKGFVNARAADIICTSKRLADTTPLTKIACPFESGSQRGILEIRPFEDGKQFKRGGDSSPPLIA
ncbi:uncharacterized protein LOC111263058 isoform X2 [Varroa jacobsoni]|uniref:Uncharacterized protein n=1 Tax=Varroa destructor TaxID=109461 RepID=A0A7M7J8X0_VARDE|nr:uncharacterized protein LOC111244793 isoform X2 [Varroa destructor]XP_022693554.1 uncharacterized protein LOC111263058 isoform X2 [Varroa jacobsoni]